MLTRSPGTRIFPLLVLGLFLRHGEWAVVVGVGLSYIHTYHSNLVSDTDHINR